jgi:alpha-L-arabinofuranosidase
MEYGLIIDHFCKWLYKYLFLKEANIIKEESTRSTYNYKATAKAKSQRTKSQKKPEQHTKYNNIAEPKNTKAAARKNKQTDPASTAVQKPNTHSSTHQYTRP